LLPDSIITVDRGYYDFNWFYSLELDRVYFITRAKQNLQYEVTGQQEVPKNKGVIKDQTIRLTGSKPKRYYPKNLRLITFYDSKKEKELVFITNNFKLAASTITELYKYRWQIELFFKWIKQNLKIKTFLGTSENAVMTQIWTAFIYYLLLVGAWVMHWKCYLYKIYLHQYFLYYLFCQHGYSMIFELLHKTALMNGSNVD